MECWKSMVCSPGGHREVSATNMSSAVRRLKRLCSGPRAHSDILHSLLSIQLSIKIWYCRNNTLPFSCLYAPVRTFKGITPDKRKEDAWWTTRGTCWLTAQLLEEGEGLQTGEQRYWPQLFLRSPGSGNPSKEPVHEPGSCVTCWYGWYPSPPRPQLCSYEHCFPWLWLFLCAIPSLSLKPHIDVYLCPLLDAF